MTKIIFKIIAVAFFLVGEFTQVAAQTTSQVYGDQLTKQQQTLFFRGDYEWNTFESEAVDSNATQGTTSMRVGTFAGENRMFGFFADVSDSGMDFDLNNSKIESSTYSVSMQARVWWLYPTVAMRLSEMRFVKEQEEIADIYATGFDIGAAVKIPMHYSTVLELEAKQVTYNKTLEQEKRDAELIGGTEYSATGKIDLVSQYIDLALGYKFRQFDLQLDEENYNQNQSMPFVGLQAGIFF